MATIQAFRPLRPNPFYADQLVFTKPETESVAGDVEKKGSLRPLKDLLETPARIRPETSEGQAAAYRQILDTLDDLLEQEKIWREPAPGIFIYEFACKSYRQTGIWALTSLDDYIAGRIKTHERTLTDSVRRLKNYRHNTGIEGSPVLLVYKPEIAVNRIIVEAKDSPAKVVWGNRHGFHRIWKIESSVLQQQLIDAFSAIETTYVADGHHRLESAAQLKLEQGDAQALVNGAISTVYMSTDQVRTASYHRVIIPDEPVDTVELFRYLDRYFYLKGSPGNKPVEPAKHHHFGMYINGRWYELLVKEVASWTLDADILQSLVFKPFFGINDPSNDVRLKYVGGEDALAEMTPLFVENPFALAFTLKPMTISEIIEAARANFILPPKSSWIIPKIPFGLMIQKH